MRLALPLEVKLVVLQIHFMSLVPVRVCLMDKVLLKDKVKMDTYL